MTKYSTRDRIIDAAIELTNERGYKGATTLAIAERAGVNEVTIFRHFGSKKGIVEAAIEKYAFLDSLSHVFDEKIVWDLRTDLRMLVREYQRLLDEKRDLILISYKESNQFPELEEMTARLPQAYQQRIEAYLSEMKDKNKINDVDIKVAAQNFIYLNFGFFMLKTRLADGNMALSLNETFIDQNIELIIQSLI